MYWCWCWLVLRYWVAFAVTQVECKGQKVQNTSSCSHGQWFYLCYVGGWTSSQILANTSLTFWIPAHPERPHQHWQHMFGGWPQTAEWKILIDEKKGWTWGAGRGNEKRKEGGEKAVDATLSELSVLNKPRCLSDKADERECMCKILSSLLPRRIDTQHCPIFLDQTLPRLTALLYICYTPPVYQRCVCVCVWVSTFHLQFHTP